MNTRLLFAIGLLISVVLLGIGNVTSLPIISLIGYIIMALLFIVAGISLAIFRRTGGLTSDGVNVSWKEASGELKALTVVVGLGFLAAGIFVIFRYIF